MVKILQQTCNNLLVKYGIVNNIVTIINYNKGQPIVAIPKKEKKMLVELTGNNNEKVKLAATYISYLNGWRLYDPKYPEWTIAIVNEEDFSQIAKEIDDE